MISGCIPCIIPLDSISGHPNRSPTNYVWQRQAREHIDSANPTRTKIVVYCHAGSRSAYAIMTLRELGYRPDLLINLKDGIDAWAADVEPTMPRY